MKYLKLLTVILRASTNEHKAEEQQYVAYLNDGRGFSRLLLYDMNVVYCRHVRYGYARNLNAVGGVTIRPTPLGWVRKLKLGMLLYKSGDDLHGLRSCLLEVFQF